MTRWGSVSMEIELHHQLAGDAARQSAPVAYTLAAVRPEFVAIRAPDDHSWPGLMQSLEPALVQMLVAELAVETLALSIEVNLQAAPTHVVKALF